MLHITVLSPIDLLLLVSEVACGDSFKGGSRLHIAVIIYYL